MKFKLSCNKCCRFTCIGGLSQGHLSGFLLNDRLQFVKLGNSSYSDTGCTNAGTPQGTLSGPMNFKVIINDLSFDEEYIKYVDDETVATVNPDPLDDSLQIVGNELDAFCPVNGMVVNTKKTNEMLIYFGHKYPTSSIPCIQINGREIQRVSIYKLLGVVLNDRLTWDDHVVYIVDKASKRIFCILQLVKARIIECDIVLIYCAIVRSILEYSCEVWHPGLSGRQSRDIERVQKRCLRIIYPERSYSEALSLCGLERLDARRERRVGELFQAIKHPGHILNSLLIPRDDVVNRPSVRFNYDYVVPLLRTDRARHDFINYCLLKYL